MAMTARRLAALQNMAALGSGQEAQTAAAMLARTPQKLGARTAMVTRSSGAMRGSIGGGVRAGTPARLPIRGAIGMGSGRNLPAVIPAAASPAVRSTVLPPRPKIKMRGPNAAGRVITENSPRPAVEAIRKGGMSRSSKIGIGLALGVAAGVAMNRRGEGASPGNQSIYRY